MGPKSSWQLCFTEMKSTTIFPLIFHIISMKSKEANIIFVLKKLIDKVVIYLLFHVSLAKLKFPSIV